MKKKLGLITLHDVKNYGSILQTYATQCYFEQLGYDVTVIDYRRPWETTFGYWFYLNDRSIKGVIRNIIYFPSKIIQYFRFKRFKSEKIRLSSKTYTSKKKLLKFPVEADVYCTGSDQVWNSGWNGGVIPEYFLNFVSSSSGTKKISFAASFGESALSEEEKKEILLYLQEYDLITVREQKSVTMLRNDLSLNAVEILDPTLQMSGEFWRNLCPSDRMIKNKYILIVQLNRSHTFDHIAMNFAKKKGLPLVRLCLRVDQIVLPGNAMVVPKVENYVRLIRDAEWVLTDSFHAISFCLNLNKQFYCCLPDRYSERLENILELTGLKQRIVNRVIESDLPIDFESINKFLLQQRANTLKLLKRVLNDECE